MNIKKIALKNIRSYKEQEIIFPEGSILLSGDIGSGKTSILLAIEFALFGLQPGQKGSSLLRNGESEGGAIIEFEVDGRDVVIQRTLKRGKSIAQDYCSIMIDDIIKEVSVTELKSIVLDLLNYPKEFSKKQNLLYKFTVYTPQEEMKEIILQDPETRINTLRHVFGIDKYKRILENTSILTSKLREEKRFKEALISHLEKDKEDILTKENDLEAKRYNLLSIERELFLKTEARKKIQDEKDEISKKIDEKNNLQSEIAKTRIMIGTKNETISNNQKLMGRIHEQINELSHLSFEPSMIKSLENEISMLKNEEKILNEKNLQITSMISSFSLKNQESENLKTKISGMRFCPTCLQDVGPVHKSNVINKVETDITENSKQIDILANEKKPIIIKLSDISSKLNNFQNKIQELRIIKVKLESLYEKKSRLKEIEEQAVYLNKDIELLNNHMAVLKNSVFELNKYDNIFEQKKTEFESALKEERIAEIKVAELKKEIEVFENQIEELKEKVNRLETIKHELHYISNIENWLNTNFIPLISAIEKNVMVKLKNEFSALFSKWFSMLVPDNFNVRLDDEFTPVVEQYDYELDYDYLSGGERTAIALAYRLSLNQVLNSLLSQIKTKGLVILDEPTDGFSDQQLDKMREVLDELNVAQLIIVSHEPKIEGFVDNVIRLAKDSGVSQKM